MSKTLVRRAFKYRFYPTEGQAAQLSRTFGCWLVYNKALDARSTAWSQQARRAGYAETSALPTAWKKTAWKKTAWKKTEELAFLGEVSSVPLRQTLRHLQKAFTNFWDKQATYPTAMSRKKGKVSAE